MARSHSSLELLFTTGDEFGIGTYGLGSEAARSASAKLHDTMMESYWKDKERIHHEWKMKDHQAAQNRIAAGKRSPRQRMEEAMIEREMAIKKQVEQRKAEEKMQREQREKEYAERNAAMHAMKQAELEQRREANWRREEEKRYELDMLHAQRAEMLSLVHEEREQEVSAQRSHAVKVRQWQEVTKQRAKEEAQRRFEAAQTEAKEMRRRQRNREEKAKHMRKDISSMKKDLVKGIRTHEKSEHYRPIADLASELATVASSIRKDVKEQLEECQRKQQLRLEERKSCATQLREAQAESRRLYDEERRRQQELMQRSVKQQREEGRRALEEEAERKHREHQEYMAMLRDIAQRTSSGNDAKGAERRVASISPPRKQNKTNSAGSFH